MNKFNEVTHRQMHQAAHLQMRREQLKKLEMAAAAANRDNSDSTYTPTSAWDDVKFTVLYVVMRFCAWLAIKVHRVVTAVVNVFSRQEDSDLYLAAARMAALAVFSIPILNENERSDRLLEVFEALSDCFARAKDEQDLVLARVHDAGGMDAIVDDNLRVELDRVNAQVETVFQKVEEMCREVVTFRNIWRH